MTLKIVQHRAWWYGISMTLFAASVVFIGVGGLRLSTDFTGGSLSQLRFAGERPAAQVMTDTISALGFGAAAVQLVDDDSALVRTRELTPDEHANFVAKVGSAFPGVQEEAFSSVGPLIGKELRQRAVVATLLVLLGIILYVTWAFRKSSRRLSGWAFGVNAIVALLHDVVITVGFFAFLGYSAKVEVDVLFVTALLTTLGFSVHDTIVVFDRLREWMRRYPGTELEMLINDSVNTTLVRSINTSFTTLLVLAALFLFGGSTIHYFVLALIVGITIGTYSSIFVASPLLLLWERGRRKR